jgi:hypothetical protein
MPASGEKSVLARMYLPDFVTQNVWQFLKNEELCYILVCTAPYTHPPESDSYTTKQNAEITQ